MGTTQTVAAFVLALAAGTPAAPGRPPTPVADWILHTPERAWLHADDPTLVSRRVQSELSFEDRDGGASLWKLQTSLRWPLPITENVTSGAILYLPYLWKDSGAGTEQQNGPGDVEIRPGIIWRISDDLRLGMAMNFALDTANEPLGGNAFVMRQIIALRWDVNNRLNTGINVEYGFTPRDEGSDDVSELRLKLPLTFKIDDCWSGKITYKPRFDFRQDSERHRIELGLTHVWGPDRQLAWSIKGEMPLASESPDWKLLASLAWSF